MSINNTNYDSPFCNSFDDCNNDWTGFYFLFILSLFLGGGLGPSSFWGAYNNIYSCSGFNNAWCNSMFFPNGNFNSNAFSGFN